MKKIVITSTLLVRLATSLIAQEKVWTLNDCMQYAVENSPKIKQKKSETDSYKAGYISSIGDFLPSIETGLGTDFNFGRSANPIDNSYSNVSTFNNYYSAAASLYLFRGGILINQWRQAKVNVTLGKTDEQYAKDELAMNIMDTYVNTVYYKEMSHMAMDKLEESKNNLYMTQRKEELGLKSLADVAQMEAQVATDEYNLTNYQNLYNTNLLSLKESMNFPVDEELQVDLAVKEKSYLPGYDSVTDIYEYAKENNPAALKADLQLRQLKLQHKIAKGDYFPTISFYGQIYTNYYNILNASPDEQGNNPKDNIDPFNTQFKNNRNEYIGISLTIPIFKRLNTISNARKARNNARIAAEQQTETLRQLHKTIEQSILDREGYAKEVFQLEKQVEYNAIAYRLNQRKYEEGLLSSIELQVSANDLLKARADLLQKQLMYIMKSRIVDYYKGIPLVENN
ncbi:MAG: TolC family protein [Tannerellaceae bacterium]|nr:TolC family protein [Tannerellaceae bacterium]